MGKLCEGRVRLLSLADLFFPLSARYSLNSRVNWGNEGSILCQMGFEAAERASFRARTLSVLTIKKTLDRKIAWLTRQDANSLLTCFTFHTYEEGVKHKHILSLAL